LRRRPRCVYVGEDVEHGGYYRVTEGLVADYSRRRIFDWPPDETSLIGGGIGMAQAGFLPIVELPYAAYLTCGYNQFVEASFLFWLSDGKQPNGMVLRMQGFDEGVFGGHFHTANAPPVFGIPGLDVVAYSNGADWQRGLRTALQTAEQGGVTMLLDSTALLNRKHLTRGDGAWQFLPPPEADMLLFDDVVLYADGRDVSERVTLRAGIAGADGSVLAEGREPRGKGVQVAVVTYGNGVPKALQARAASGLAFDVIDSPLLSRPPTALMDVLRGGYDTLLLVDPCREGAGPLPHFVAPLQAASALPPTWRLLTATATYNPLGRTVTFVSCEDIIDSLERLATPVSEQAHVPSSGRGNVDRPCVQSGRLALRAK